MRAQAHAAVPARRRAAGVVGNPTPERPGTPLTGRGRWWRIDDDKGAMTVTTAFAVAALLAVTVAVLLVGRAAVAAHAVRSAADLSALAGAEALRTGGDPCAAAAGVATANGAALAVCTVDHHDVVVRAELRVGLGPVGTRSASAVARAGPV